MPTLYTQPLRKDSFFFLDKRNRGIMRYKIIEDTINNGGFGRIYKAYDMKFKNTVAIKEFYVESLDQSKSRMQSVISTCPEFEQNKLLKLLEYKFKEEAKMLSALNTRHGTHVPKIFKEAFEVDGRLVYIMNFINGMTLRETVEANGTINESTAISYIVQIGKVLHEAHSAKMYHRDISPNNIMVEDNKAVLVDFGNAKAYDIKKSMIELLSRNVTPNDMHTMELIEILRNSSNVGIEGEDTDLHIATGGYDAPDDIYGTGQGDVFSLAATMFFILTGEEIPTVYGDRNDFKKNLYDKLAASGISMCVSDAIFNALDRNQYKLMHGIEGFVQDLPHNDTINALLNY